MFNGKLFDVESGKELFVFENVLFDEMHDKILEFKKTFKADLFRLDISSILDQNTDFEIYLGNDIEKDLSEINDAIDSLSIDQINILVLVAQNNHITCLYEALTNSIDDITFYEMASSNESEAFAELAEMLHNEGSLWLDIPENLVNFIDWEKVGSELKHEYYFANGYMISE